jgi:multimeric flavodoxin WrbA
MSIKICSIFGSPRKGGFSSGLHESFLSSISSADITRYYIHDLNINPCTGCKSCQNESRCFHRDDMDSILSSARESDLITFSFPLYFTSLPGPLKTVIDRFQLIWYESKRGGKAYNDKRGIAFITAGSNYQDMFTPSLKILSHVMNTFKGKLLSDQCLLCPDLDSQGSSTIYKKALERAKTLGQNLPY